MSKVKSKVIATLCEMYRTEMTRLMASVWMGALEGYSDSELETGLSNWVKNSTEKFMPPPGLFLEYCKPGGSDALTAWETAINSVKNHGAYNSPNFSDPSISHVIKKMGGWVQFCGITIESLPFKQREFEAEYRQISSFKDEPIPLSGLLDKNTNKMAKIEFFEPAHSGSNN